jgi:hypothetical protein
MLIDKKYKVKPGSKTTKYYRELGYDASIGNEIMVSVEHLTNGSHTEVDVECDRCGDVFNRKYKAYLKYRKNYDYDTCQKCKYEKVKATNVEKFGVENPFQSNEIKEKMKETWIEKYGVDNPAKSDDIQNKIKETNLEKYGYEYGLSNPEVREKISKTKSDMGLQLPTDEIDKYKVYRNKVNSLTRLVKEDLYNNWDGYDYYDNEYIKDNVNLHFNDANYPTIDHKTSVLYGFLNGISEEEICEMDNLCITKRSINASKCFRIESVYK